MGRISDISIGSVKVTALRDGERSLPAEALVNLAEADAKTIAGDENNSLSLTNFNAFLVRTGDRNLLVDAGCRDLFGPTCGFLAEALAEAGIGPDDITDLFLTHLHPDHIAGAVDAGGAAVFTNAVLKVAEAERDYWTSGAFGDADVNGKDWAGLAGSVLDAYKDRLDIIQPDGEIIPGVASVGIPGHTPGHTGFRVDSGKESLVHLGDIFHVQNLQLADPNIRTAFDVDPDTALASRKRMLDMVSSDGSLCTSGHILAPKFVHASKQGSGYSLTG